MSPILKDPHLYQWDLLFQHLILLIFAGIEIKPYATRYSPRTKYGREYSYKLDHREIIEKMQENLGNKDFLCEKPDSTNSTNSTEKSIEDELATLDSAHTDQFLEESFTAEAPLTTNSTNSIPELENDDDADQSLNSPAECSKSSAPITKKVLPPIPPKPIKLQVKKESIPEPISESVPEPANLELEGPELHPQIDEDEFWSAILSEINIPEPISEPEIINSTPEPTSEPIVYMDKKLEELYQGIKANWEKCSNDPEDFDWGLFIEEIIDHKNHLQYDYQKDLFHMHIQGQLYVPPKNYRTTLIIKPGSSVNEKECALTNGEKFFGSNFSRKRINHKIEKIRTRIPNHQFQVLLPYENYKPGSWFEDGEDISLFLLLDHYDELQLPEGGGDPVTYNQFIVYMMDPPTLAGGCNAWSALSSKDPKRDRRLNDCLYQCLYYTYGTFSNLPRTIEKPDILKQILGLERCNPIPVHLIEKVEKLAKSIAINIVGDAT
ncbi:10095_t:CDS:2 [Entrophospora sp. SA101]|nr:6643_t:CDS:2 [Entrophospora sp. SA101]CAJ0842463.1 10095_t:CDS:2 [Entrophospora sp. SA101]